MVAVVAAWSHVRNGARHLSTLPKEIFVLGIETSCDDTGASIVSSNRHILSNAKESQVKIHLQTGGIVPKVAQQLHQENIQSVVERAINDSGLSTQDVDAIAVTRGPGMSLSLSVGTEYALKLAKEFNKPLIPVHHMEAHGLTARLTSPHLSFPFLVLLVSGGHCILAVCEGIGQWYRLGQSLDDSPGEAFDKVSRMLRLHRHSLGEGVSGGVAIETVSQSGDPLRYPLPNIMIKKLNCNFSFAGIKTSVSNLVDKLDVTSNDTQSLEPVPDCEHIAASFQKSAVSHLINRTHRAILYCREKWPSISQIVVSGGVASNSYLRNQLSILVDHYEYTLHVPPPYLCTDNGVMIAWAGIESIYDEGLPGCAIPKDIDALYYYPRWELGKDVSDAVSRLNIKVKKLRQ